jgi:hypothetical protein
MREAHQVASTSFAKHLFLLLSRAGVIEIDAFVWFVRAGHHVIAPRIEIQRVDRRS